MTDIVISPPPNLPTLLGPILPALPSATISTEPAVGILPLLSPLLRQRVQIFSATSTEPWLKWLCYSSDKAAKLAQVVRSGSLEPHPVSGEVEVDWEYDSETSFRRLDRETLQALTVLPGLGLSFQLLYCSQDAESGGDGSNWRVGEVSVADTSSAFSQSGWYASISEAESQFQTAESSSKTKEHLAVVNGIQEDDGDDDGYWDRYDATPARSPANPQTPAPTTRSHPVTVNPPPLVTDDDDDDDDDDYYAQYDQIQPAMDNHDPDEEEAAHLTHHQIDPPLGLDRISTTLDASLTEKPTDLRSSWTLTDLDKSSSSPPLNLNNHHPHHHHHHHHDPAMALLHPRPESIASSNGVNTIAHLEASAGKQEQSEFGVKQHVSRTIRSLYSLSRASGIEREEFERIVRTELDLLGMMGDQD